LCRRWRWWFSRGKRRLIGRLQQTHPHSLLLRDSVTHVSEKRLARREESLNGCG
jgi:hypothetical protein